MKLGLILFVFVSFLKLIYAGSLERSVSDLKHLKKIRNSIEQNGLKFEEHFVRTDDNYILTLFRVYKPGIFRGKPVFVQHGIFQDAGIWILNEHEQGEKA